MVNTVSIRVPVISLAKMRKECKEIFLKAHPEMKGLILTDGFMFNKLTEWYCK